MKATDYSSAGAVRNLESSRASSFGKSFPEDSDTKRSAQMTNSKRSNDHFAFGAFTPTGAVLQAASEQMGGRGRFNSEISPQRDFFDTVCGGFASDLGAGERENMMRKPAVNISGR
ncbi:hypothetical protein AiwAL_04140 [Acidiphilium sp. AL]|uniref:hypothetical protein n=1 Tax=Acidiphilium TaxID=522 RepID=UPI001F17FEBB|nr:MULTISPECIES: hypothetical protein [Acidiphilium]MCU4159295.1 hypothetical protein [Acidiphilium sp. AL]